MLLQLRGLWGPSLHKWADRRILVYMVFRVFCRFCAAQGVEDGPVRRFIFGRFAPGNFGHEWEFLLDESAF